MNIARPHYESVPLATGLRWNASSGLHFTEKLDGIRHELAIGKSVVVGELMADKRFFAFDLPVHDGQDIRKLPRRQRLAILETFSLLRPESSTNGGELLQRVLARGGEGVCAADWQSGFNDVIWRCKRVESYDCVVTDRDIGRGSIRLSLDGQDAGWCPAKASFWKIKLGDVVEVAAMCRHVGGKFREPRFLRVRPDKVV